MILAQVVAVAIALAAVAFDLGRAGAREGAGAGVIAACVVAVPASFFVARAELYSLALFPVLVALLREEDRRMSRRIWLAVPLLVLWANLHGGRCSASSSWPHTSSSSVPPAIRSARGSSLLASAAALVATPSLLETVDYYSGVLHGKAAAEHYGLWARLSFRDPLDVLLVVIAVPLVIAALRRRPRAWQVVVLLALCALTVNAHRNGLWLVLFAATPAARAFGYSSAQPWLSRRPALICFCVPAAMLALGFSRPVAIDGASEPLLRRAAALADGSPILAEPVAAEQLALRGDRIWIGNPIDAFTPRDQFLYLEWLRGRADGDQVLRGPSRVVRRPARQSWRSAGSPLSGNFRELARDAHAVLYTRAK